MATESTTKNQTYNLVLEGIPYAYDKFLKPTLKYLGLPIIIGTALSSGTYLSSNYLRGEKISVNELEEKTYITVSQGGLFNNRTDIQKDGRIGKTLEQLENENIEVMTKTYNSKEKEIKDKYDKMMKDAEDEAKEAWGASKPPVVKETTKYHENICTIYNRWNKNEQKTGVKK